MLPWDSNMLCRGFQLMQKVWFRHDNRYNDDYGALHDVQLCFMTVERNITVMTDTSMPKSYVKLFEAYIYIYIQIYMEWSNYVDNGGS